MEVKSIQDISNLLQSGKEDFSDIGRVRTKTQNDLVLFNYTAEAQWGGNWNWFETVCRGLILDRQTGECVARPFDKFFNYGQEFPDIRDQITEVTEKMDGSLGIMYRVDGEYRVATRGSFDSDQAVWATEWLNRHRSTHKWDAPSEITLLFEIIYPDNRIVVDYKDMECLVLIGARNRHTGYDFWHSEYKRLAEEFNFSTPETFQRAEIGDYLTMSKSLDIDTEGYVLRFASGKRLKIKGDKYRDLHRFLSGLSFNRTLEAVRDGTVEAVRETVPDEFLSDFNQYVSTITERIDHIETETKKVFLEIRQGEVSDRKSFAQVVLSRHKEYAPYLFAMLDNKPIRDIILKKAFN